MPLDQPVSFNRFGALCAFAAAATGFAYSTSFSLYLNDPSRGTAYADSLLLLVGGLVSTAAFTAVDQRLRATDEAFALWGYVLALVAVPSAQRSTGATTWPTSRTRRRRCRPTFRARAT